MSQGEISSTEVQECKTCIQCSSVSQIEAHGYDVLPAFQQFEHALRTSHKAAATSAFAEVHGCEMWDYFKGNPEKQKRFSRGMKSCDALGRGFPPVTVDVLTVFSPENNTTYDEFLLEDHSITSFPSQILQIPCIANFTYCIVKDTHFASLAEMNVLESRLHGSSVYASSNLILTSAESKW